MRLLALDPGFANLGWAVLTVGPDGVDVVARGLIETAKENRKRQLHSGSDDGRRIDELAGQLAVVRVQHAVSRTFDLGAYELPSAAKGARAAHALGLAHAISRMSLRRLCSSVVEVTVADARRVAAGVPKAKEAAAHDAIKARWPHLTQASTHELDAVAVGLAALETPVGMALSAREAG